MKYIRNIIYFIPILFCIVSITSYSKDVRLELIQSSLPPETQRILDKIIKKIEGDKNREYYISKLNLLLSTQTRSRENTRDYNITRINRDIKETKKKYAKIIRKHGKHRLDSIIYREEKYESEKHREWKKYRSDGNKYFYASYDSYIDILVHINVSLDGSHKSIKHILFLEDEIEKHLNINGFSVNIEFVPYNSDDEDVYNVNVNQNKWTTAHNWSGDYQGMAHELLHLLGLDDEYNRIEAHAGNRNMSTHDRLIQFYIQLHEKMIPGAEKGIMCYSNYRPLHRHVCEVIREGSDCVRVREEYFGEK